jgi:hypothetical protein
LDDQENRLEEHNLQGFTVHQLSLLGYYSCDHLGYENSKRFWLFFKRSVLIEIFGNGNGYSKNIFSLVLGHPACTSLKTNQVSH